MNDIAEKIDKLCEDVTSIKTKMDLITLPLNCAWHSSRISEVEKQVEDTNIRVTALEKWQWKKEGALILVIGLVTLFGSHISDVIFGRSRDNSLMHSSGGIIVPSAISQVANTNNSAMIWTNGIVTHQ